MADLVLLNQEMTDLRNEREELRKKHQGATMPEEARARDMEIIDRVKRLTFVIEEEQQKERDHLMEKTADFLDKPQYQINRAVNADDESRRTIARAGWEIKGGQVMRQTSTGEIAFCPEEVLFGSVPTNDPELAQFYKKTRATFQPEYRNAYVKWLKASVTGPGADGFAMNSLTGEERNALSEGSAVDGGFLVPPDVQSEILSRLAQQSVMGRLCRTITTTRDKVVFPAMKAASSNGTIYSGGFVGTVVGETPAFAENDPQFEQFEISIKKFRTSTKMSNDWLSDSGALSFISASGAENLALTEDYYFINGDGTANQPLGILNSGLSTTTVEGSTTDQISNTISNAGSAPLIDALPYLVPSQYVSGASWLMARTTEGKIRGLVDANARPWWMPQQVAGGAGSTPNELGGYPVYNSDWVPVGGTNGNKVLIFGNFNAYIIARRASMSTIVLRERFADTEQTGIIIMSRAGGGLWNTDAMYLGIV
jgi:HK97 family phage major capsid protein